MTLALFVSCAQMSIVRESHNGYLYNSVYAHNVSYLLHPSWLNCYFHHSILWTMSTKYTTIIADYMMLKNGYSNNMGQNE